MNTQTTNVVEFREGREVLPGTRIPARPLDAVMWSVRRFVSLSESQARGVALWAAHTHAIEAADATPYLAVNSAEKGSGKTRLLEVLRLLVRAPWMTGRVTAAVLVRKVDAEQPTLLLDESDAAFGSGDDYAEALRGVLNTGYRRGGAASLCVGKGADIKYKDFSTFGAKAIAGLGRLPDTVGDRSIPIRLKRARHGEVERFRERDAKREAEVIRQELAAWVKPHLGALKDARPEMPEGLTDRQADVCEPLLALADLAGGEWPGAARAALVELCGQGLADDGSVGVWLLTDIRYIFAERDSDRMPSAELVEALALIETSPWSEWFHGKPLTPPRLARLLRAFDVTPRNLKVGDGRVLKGYLREDFSDAWGRYLPSSTAPLDIPTQNRYGATDRVNSGDNTLFEGATESAGSGSGNGVSARKNEGGSRVAVSGHGNEQREPLEGAF